MKRTICWICTAFVCGTAQAAGFFHDRDALEELRLAYDSNNPKIKAAYFRGYVAGVADSGHGNAWCPAGKVSPERTYWLVSKYLKEHPASTADQDAAEAVMTALGAAFPCPGR